MSNRKAGARDSVEMKGICSNQGSCVPKKKCFESCDDVQGIFGNMKPIPEEKWKGIEFESEDAKSRSVLIVAKTEAEPFGGFYVRRWDHPYEPNFETRTYNLLEFCQQRKVKRFFETGRAGNLIVWTKDEKNGGLYFIGAYKRVRKLRNVLGRDRGGWRPRVALMADETFVLPHGKGVPMEDFEADFRKQGFAFPSKERISPFHSCYGHYVINKELTNLLTSAIGKNAVDGKVYLDLAEPYAEELSKLRQSSNRKINVQRFRQRFVTQKEMGFAKDAAILY